MAEARQPHDPQGIPLEHVERLGVRFYFDTNFVTDDSPAAQELRQLHRDGWISLWRTDTVDTELASMPDGERRRELLEATSHYVQSFGPMVLGHSRLDFAVLGSDEDTERLDRVFAILFPGSARRDQSTGRARRKLRAAMHVATAIRYGANAFITRDGDDLLPKDAAIAKALNGFRIMTPECALAFAHRMLERYKTRMARDD